MSLKITFYDKNNNFIKEISPKKEELFNKILKRKKSILDLALDNKIDLKFGCMGGSCSACKCVVLKGEEFIQKDALHPIVYKGMKNREILTCIATIKDIDEEKEVNIELKLLL